MMRVTEPATLGLCGTGNCATEPAVTNELPLMLRKRHLS
jgi:hypothetical protein